MERSAPPWWSFHLTPKEAGRPERPPWHAYPRCLSSGTDRSVGLSDRSLTGVGRPATCGRADGHAGRAHLGHLHPGAFGDCLSLAPRPVGDPGARWLSPCLGESADRRVGQTGHSDLVVDATAVDRTRPRGGDRLFALSHLPVSREPPPRSGTAPGPREHGEDLVGESITFSAATVIAALLSLVLASFGLYRSVGPGLAIGIIIVLIIDLTFFPTLLAILGQSVFFPSVLRPDGPVRGRWGKARSASSATPSSLWPSARPPCRAWLAASSSTHLRVSIPVGTSLVRTPSSARRLSSPTSERRCSEAPTSSSGYPTGRGTTPRSSPKVKTGSTLPDCSHRSLTRYLRVGRASQPDGLGYTYRRLGPPADLPPLHPRGPGPDCLLQHVHAGRAIYQSKWVQHPVSSVVAGRIPGEYRRPPGHSRHPCRRRQRGHRDRSNRIWGCRSGRRGRGREHDLGLGHRAHRASGPCRSHPAPCAGTAVPDRADLPRSECLAVVSCVTGICRLGLCRRRSPARDRISRFPFFMFVFIMALGEDYNILVMSTDREEAGRAPLPAAVATAVGSTGTTVASAGLVLAGTFGVLAITTSGQIRQIGTGLAFGILLDTFVVRTLLVPSAVVLLGRWNWWPSRRFHSPDPLVGDAP